MAAKRRNARVGPSDVQSLAVDRVEEAPCPRDGSPSRLARRPLRLPDFVTERVVAPVVATEYLSTAIQQVFGQQFQTFDWANLAKLVYIRVLWVLLQCVVYLRVL